METGRTVILLNLENLYESLYDVLNQVCVCVCVCFEEDKKSCCVCVLRIRRAVKMPTDPAVMNPPSLKLETEP